MSGETNSKITASSTENLVNDQRSLHNDTGSIEESSDLKKDSQEEAEVKVEEKSQDLEVDDEHYDKAEVIVLKESSKVKYLVAQLNRSRGIDLRSSLSDGADCESTGSKTENLVKDQRSLHNDTESIEESSDLKKDSREEAEVKVEEENQNPNIVYKYYDNAEVTALKESTTSQLETIHLLTIKMLTQDTEHEAKLQQHRKEMVEKDAALLTVNEHLQSKESNLIELNKTVQESKIALCDMEKDLQSKESTLIEIKKLNNEKDLALTNLKNHSKLKDDNAIKLNKDIEEANKILLGVKKELLMKDDFVIDLNKKLEEKNKAMCAMKKNLQIKEDTITVLNDRTYLCKTDGNKADPSNTSDNILSEELIGGIEDSYKKNTLAISSNAENIVSEDRQEVIENSNDNSNIDWVEHKMKSCNFTMEGYDLSDNDIDMEENIESNLQHPSVISSTSDTVSSKSTLELENYNNEELMPNIDAISSNEIVQSKLGDHESIGKESTDTASDLPAESSLAGRKNHSVDMKMPVGTTRASVAMAAARAMKTSRNFGTGGLSGIMQSQTSGYSLVNLGRNLRSTEVSPTSLARQELLDFQIKAKNHNIEISRLTKENVEYAKKVALLEQQINCPDNVLSISTHFGSETVMDLIKTSSSSQQVDDSSSRNSSVDTSVSSQCQSVSSKSKVNEDILENNKEGIELREENKVLLGKVQILEKEVDNVSALLAETIRAVKGNENEIQSVRLSDGEKPERSRMFSRFITTPKRDNSNALEQTSTDTEHLIRVCKVHQFTVVKQSHIISEMQKTLEENESNLNRMAVEAELNTEKIDALENQFMQLNDAKENNGIQTVLSGDSYIGQGASIIKIDAAYVSTLESDLSKRSITIEELKNQLNQEQARYSELKGKARESDDLKDEIATIMIKLKARDATISALDTSYRLQQTPTPERKKRPRALANNNNWESNQNTPTSPIPKDDAVCGNMNPQVKRVATSNLPFQISISEKSTVHPRDKERYVILSIRKVTLLQEMLDSSCRRVNSVLNRVEDAKTNDMNEPFVFSLCDKFAIMQDYIKISLHLLQTKLSNELESVRLGNGNGIEEDEDTIQLRFDRTMESLCESEKKNEDFLDELRKELNHQTIKIYAKDSVIEDLMRAQASHTIEIENLDSELNMLKSLSDYSTVNVGIIAKFKEFSKVQDELQDKDRIIYRLNNVIEEYRVQEDFS